MSDDSTLVYSTESGDQRSKPDKGSKSKPAQAAGKRSVVVSRSRKGRGGKTVTVVAGLQHCPDAFDKLAKQLKQLCGSGGAVKDGEIIIQGDHRDKVAGALAQQGYKVKVSG